MAGTDGVSFSLITLDQLRPVLTNQPLGDGDMKLRIASARLSVPVDIAGAPPLVVRFRAGAELSLYVFNGKTGSDIGGIVEAGPRDAWIKYVCAADIAVDGRLPLGPATFAGRAGTAVTFADYHCHSVDTGVATAVERDLASQRVALVREHVLTLAAKDAVVFETRGELTAAVDVEWSDIFTSEIGALMRLMNVHEPIAIATTVGLTCSAKVTVTDTFAVAFARASDGAIRVAIRKGQVDNADLTGGVSVTAAIDDRAALERVVDEVLDSSGAGDASAFGEPVADVRARAIDAIEEVAKTKIGAAFAYEYHRVESTAAVFEATIAAGELSPQLHAALVCGDLAAAFSTPPSVLTLSRYLNETKLTTSRAWGFTLGIGKWQVFGRDRRRLSRVARYDVSKQMESRSYIGSGGYERTHLTWMVDFKADMRGWAAVPLVSDYTFGLHLAWVCGSQTFDSGDLDSALDFAALWKICPEASLAWLRDRLAPVLGQRADWSFHVRLKDAVLRPAIDAIAAVTPADLAAAAAEAMDAGVERRLPSARRALFAPLWRAVLRSADQFAVETVVECAGDVLSDSRAAWRERQVVDARTVDGDTVAGIVRSNPETFHDCERLIRGCRTLRDALAVSARDAGVVEQVYADLAPFWSQSHQVRMLGALLTDLSSGVATIDTIDTIDRALNIRSGGRTVVIGTRD